MGHGNRCLTLVNIGPILGQVPERILVSNKIHAHVSTDFVDLR